MYYVTVGELAPSDNDSTNAIQEVTVPSPPSGYRLACMTASMNKIYYMWEQTSLVITVSSSFQIGEETHVLANVLSPFTVTLPPKEQGRKVTIKKIDSTTNTLTINTPDTALIDGNATYSISTMGWSIDVISDGSNWYIV